MKQQGSKIQQALEALPEQGRAAFLDHIDGETSADWLARTFAAHGFSVSASTIKAYRAARKESK